MYRFLTSKTPLDTDYPPRQKRIHDLSAVLNGGIYDALNYCFQDEFNSSGEYIPIRERRPSVRYGLCRIVVDDSVSLLFSEGHFPDIETGEKGGAGSSQPVKEALQRIAKECRLNQAMIDAATMGAVGSVAILLRVLSSRVFVDAMPTEFLTPTWKSSEPDVLEMVTERYKSTKRALADAGITVDETDATDSTQYWYQRDWTVAEEVHYIPLLVSESRDGNQPRRDEKRTIRHGLGFVPIVWVRNLPGGDEIDGGCTFAAAIDTQIEIEYQLSQGGRGLKYSSEPTLALKEPAQGMNGEMIRGAGNAIVLSKDGDAKLLEIEGTAAEAVINYCKALREHALEAAHGNRSDASKLSAATSGRAMELMNQALIWLADRLRISYGEGALLAVISMIIKASVKFPLNYKDGSQVGKLVLSQPPALRWPDWYPPTNEDKQQLAGTLNTLITAGIMSKQTAIKIIAAVYDIEDVDAEKLLIQSEQKEADERAAAQAQATEQVKANVND